MGIDHSNPYIHSTTVLCDSGNTGNSDNVGNSGNAGNSGNTVM